MKFSEKTVQKVERFIAAHQLFSNNIPVLCAVSGGIDSVVMAEIMNRLGYSIGLAHCNFQLRGKDAGKDEAFVKKLAQRMNVPFFSTQFNTTAYANQYKISIQMAARELRYDWLEKTRKENNFHCIVTAHHLNDSIETILLNLVKGTGIAGIKGIPLQHDKIKRPLLCLTKKEIEHFAKKEKLSFRTDLSNAENKYERNRIRNKVLPELHSLNPSLEVTFQKNIGHFNDAHELTQYALQQLKKKLIEKRNGNIIIPIKKILTLPGWKTVLNVILSEYHFGNVQSTEALKLIHASSGRQIENEFFRLLKDRDFFIIAPQAATAEDHPVYLIENASRKIKTPHFTVKLEVKKFKGVQHKSTGWFMQLDTDKIKFPLMLRKWKAGDYFYPLGMNKKKKISDFLIDEKVSALEKEKTYVLLSEEKIVAVLKNRIDERFKTTATTRKSLEIKVK
jgi:tRNA(Ile)-lysidine synthase